MKFKNALLCAAISVSFGASAESVKTTNLVDTVLSETLSFDHTVAYLCELKTDTSITVPLIPDPSLTGNKIDTAAVPDITTLPYVTFHSNSGNPTDTEFGNTIGIDGFSEDFTSFRTANNLNISMLAFTEDGTLVGANNASEFLEQYKAIPQVDTKYYVAFAFLDYNQTNIENMPSGEYTATVSLRYTCK